MTGPIPQDQDYHHFADNRVVLGVTNAADTLSSVAFLAVGVWGLFVLWRQRASGGSARFLTPDEMLPYWALFCTVALTGIGSAYYHLAPNDARLVWDRLPMAAGFMSLVAVAIVERVSVSAGTRLLVPLVALGVASVLYWPVSALLGSEDLRPYFVVQFGSLAVVLALCTLFPSRYTRGNTLLIIVVIYGIAKFLELNDREIYEFGHWVSGHTLKHLSAALAVGVLIRSLQRRAPNQATQETMTNATLPR